MDALSKKGQRKHNLTEHAISYWADLHPFWECHELPFHYPAAVDYIITGGDSVSALMEFRVRDSGISLSELEKGKKIILSVDKFNKCILLSDLLGLPVYFWVYIPHDGVLISWELYNAMDGKYIPFERINLATRTSLNDERKRNKPCIGLSLKHGKILVTGIDELG